jgi:hypothetical protein
MASRNGLREEVGDRQHDDPLPGALAVKAKR